MGGYFWSDEAEQCYCWLGLAGLDKLAWGNIKPTHTHRYWAHLIMAILAIIYICFTFYYEFDPVTNAVPSPYLLFVSIISLPTEVLTPVYSDLGDRGEHVSISRDTLHACSLIRSLWVSRSQSHLFVRITLSPIWGLD